MPSLSENEMTAKDEAQTITPPNTNKHEQFEKKSLLGKTLYIKGDFSAMENVFIDGKLDGTIALKKHKLEIGPDGKIQGNAFADCMCISGEVIGDLYAKQISVSKTGRVIGNIFAADVSIEEGAYINGGIDQQKQDVFKQFAAADMLDDDDSKGSGFGFLFRRDRALPHDNAMLLPDLRENSEIAEELSSTSAPVDINLGSGEQSIIGETVVIKGEFTSEENVIIHGHINGVLYFRNCSLGLGSHAEISGNIYVEKNVVIHGKVLCNIHAGAHVNIRNPGYIEGKISAPRVSTEKGAVIMGSIEMEPQNIEEIYMKHHGPAIVIEEPSQPEIPVPQDEVKIESASIQYQNPAWPIRYPRTDN